MSYVKVATMSTTSLELVAQQTEVVQMYINSVFRFYDLQKKPSAVSVVPIRSSEEPGFASALTTTTISPTTNAISAGLFVAVLVKHNFGEALYCSEIFLSAVSQLSKLLVQNQKKYVLPKHGLWTISKLNLNKLTFRTADNSVLILKNKIYFFLPL